ncbi:MAG TPA: SDR family oxidoreductase [Bacteroidia bacterium]
MLFKDKIVWITGASSGIGEGLAVAFAGEGAKLVLSARQKDELLRVQRRCGLNDDRCLLLPFDLADTKNVNQLRDEVMQKFGRIDILVNNGGIGQRSYALDTPIDIDRRIMEVNFFGTIALTKSVLMVMHKQNSGQIVAMSSVSGKVGFYLRSAYSASKHALHGFFDSLRMEVYKYNIGVLIVCPGRIRTNISINAVTEKGSKHGKMDEAQDKGLSPEECAKQILHALEAGREEIYVGQPREKQALLMKRFFPSLFSKIARRQKPE